MAEPVCVTTTTVLPEKSLRADRRGKGGYQQGK